jgi:two-component system nitrate/nitrite response regulator NarL
METDNRIRVLIRGLPVLPVHALQAALAEEGDIDFINRQIDSSNVCHPSGEARRPDVELLGVTTLEYALGALLWALSDAPDSRVLIVADTLTPDDMSLILVHGACGVLTSRDALTHGAQAIRAVHTGEIWGSRAVLSTIVHAVSSKAIGEVSHSGVHCHLTERESEILGHLRFGSSNKEIASCLGISDKTVKTHLQNIFEKIDIHRRQRLAATWAPTVIRPMNRSAPPSHSLGRC